MASDIDPIRADLDAERNRLLAELLNEAARKPLPPLIRIDRDGPQRAKAMCQEIAEHSARKARNAQKVT